MPKKYNNKLYQRLHTYRRKKGYYKKKNKKPRVGRAPRGLTMSIYKYKRINIESVSWSTSGVPGWDHFDGLDGISRGWAFSFSNILGHAQFVSLYSLYKMHGVRMQIYPTYNTVTSSANLVAGAMAPQIIMWTTPARVGYTIDSTLELYQQQAIKKQMVFKQGKPIDIYMKFNLLNEVYSSTTNTDYTVAPPRWISTQEIGTPHFGMNTTFTTVDGSDITSHNIKFKMIYTLYFSCKGVKGPTAE